MRRRFLLIIAACTLFAAPPGAPLCAAEPTGTIVVAMNADIRTTNPGVNRDANTDAVMMHVVEGLVAYRENGTPAPLLAQSIDFSPDGKTVTFHLRSGIRFHNGAALAAADVVWAWRRYLDPRTGWTCLADFDGSRGPKIESVEATDARTVVFKLDRAAPMLLTEMAALPCGASGIVHRDSVNADGSWNTPIGTGPYRLSQWKHGEYIELSAFTDYASRDEPGDGYTGGKRPCAAKIRWLIIRDEAARRAALIKGQIDVLPAVQVAEFADVARLPDVVVRSSPLLASNVLLIQTSDPLLANPQFRLALATAIDTHTIAQIASGGAGAADASMVPVASPYYSSEQKRGYVFSLERARQLLAASGYHGQKLTLMTNRRYTDMYDQSIMIHSMLRQAGVNIDLQVTEWATQLEHYQSGDYQLMSFGYSARTDPYLSYQSMLGDKRRSKRKVWDDPGAIALLEAAGNTEVTGERQALFDQLHAMMLKATPLVVLYNPANVVAIRRNLEGFKPWPLERERLWNVCRTDAATISGAARQFRTNYLASSVQRRDPR
jgi:peptide/nickel transport system substrate-binding protein